MWNHHSKTQLSQSGGQQEQRTGKKEGGGGKERMNARRQCDIAIAFAHRTAIKRYNNELNVNGALPRR